MGPLGVPEMIFIFVLALIVFGPKKLPELGKKLGKGMAEFRRASTELKATFQREMDNIERETRMQEVRQAATEVNSELSKAYYDDGEDDYYDAYGSGSSSKSRKTSESTKPTESAPSTGGSSDGGDSNAEAETPSSDSSSPSALAETGDDDKRPAPEKSTV